jgi:hypothetical protein
MNPGDRVVDQVFGEVVALLRRTPRLARPVAVDESREILIGLPTEKPVEVFEAVTG